ncbi:Ribosomal protein S12 methylthiotransferase RimO [Gottschalkia acidurici 9a]|uniref:Ribosomal protein uS12 methylthiotransferase RimO n=1 Tax=Gottschalkia acidurici (strain ATCC 7906 / DSM 604 / BCRC 14475 / CIP 104303 / KCTC 5404 / NCIMB 10678 / 9a) TaxID=1128398 RepID=K0AXK5_GOTA9|nr:30S ribosomal protein S12 methylthiotransferase RimO [Gottschalkia acidurici]AFS78553.1 Ribosomal protein S12 methylthiotransferase RimO [Gottschalkia acidurici 9a]
MNHSISIISLGCSKNLVDSEQMMGILKENNFILSENEEEAEIIIINTCGFIDKAKEESINTILEAAQYKENGKCKMLIVAGCLGERYREELMKELPEVDGILGTGNINDIVALINELLKGEKVIRVGEIDADYDESIRRILNDKEFTSYIKIAEGCDNLCTYCIIPSLRGKYRSRKVEDIIREANQLVSNGTKEIILIAQDTTKYGIDIYKEYKLPYLLEELNKIEGLEWIRILYLYPDTFQDELIESIKENSKVAKYVDIPIQHISNAVLKRMNRKTSKESITGLINKLRMIIPDITIRTTLIVGFPGETEDEFMELYEYVKEMKFDRLGVFTYSKEDGTPASLLDNQIDEETKVKRQDLLMELQQQISLEKNSFKIGSKYKVIIDEKAEDKVYIGRTYMDSPEIDGVVYINSEDELEVGSFKNIVISDCLEYDLIGDVLNESGK